MKKALDNYKPYFDRDFPDGCGALDHAKSLLSDAGSLINDVGSFINDEGRYSENAAYWTYTFKLTPMN